MKKLLFFNLLFLFATNYSMKQPRELGALNTLSNDVLKKIFMVIFNKSKPNTRDSFIALRKLCLISKWFREFINSNIYKECLLPIEHAAFNGQLDAFAFEKVFNKAQLYGHFLNNVDNKISILPNCAIHPDVKELIAFSVNIAHPSLYNSNNRMYQMSVFVGSNQKSDGTYALVQIRSSGMMDFINKFSDKPHTLTNEQLEMLYKVYSTNNTVDALKNLYIDFSTTINAEQYLHTAFNMELEIPSGLFKNLLDIRGDINSCDANGKTFIEKVTENSAYNHLISELNSLITRTK